MSTYVCTDYFQFRLDDEWPPFGKELLTWLTVCSLCFIMYICNFSLFTVWVLLAPVPDHCFHFTLFELRHEKLYQLFACAKTKTQISCAVTAQLISAFVFTTWIVRSLIYLNLKFQASSHLLWLYSPVCVGPGRKPRRPRLISF